MHISNPHLSSSASTRDFSSVVCPNAMSFNCGVRPFGSVSFYIASLQFFKWWLARMAFIASVSSSSPFLISAPSNSDVGRASGVGL